LIPDLSFPFAHSHAQQKLRSTIVPDFELILDDGNSQNISIPRMRQSAEFHSKGFNTAQVFVVVKPLRREL